MTCGDEKVEALALKYRNPQKRNKNILQLIFKLGVAESLLYARNDNEEQQIEICIVCFMGV